MENATEEAKTFIAEKVMDLIDYIGRVQTMWAIIATVVLAIAFIYALCSFRRKVISETKAQIQFFKKVKKYEPSLYIELNRNMECLRYFIFSHKWKRRIICMYNKLFTGFDGEKLKKSFKDEGAHKISYFTKMPNLFQYLNSLNSLFESIRSEREIYREKLGEYFFIVRNLAFDYSNITNLLLQYCNMVSSKAILLVGSAGNGKTNLMCRMSEIAINNRIPVLLINSRDIDEDCIDYILNKLPIPKKLKWTSKIYLHIISCMLMIQRKNFYILIDAINENDRDVFINSIGRMVDFFSKYPRICIALSCRSEYFESRYKNYFEECEKAPLIFDIMTSRYNDRASEKMFNTYSKHYNVGGRISYHARTRLLKSLFLMRIFFEVNCNRNESVIELRNADIYYSYLERVNSEIKTINFIELVYKVAKVMIENSNYSHVTIESLNISGEEKTKLFRVLDDNLIISRTVFTGQGITKNEDEVITFVFDEFRDFCLARYLLLYSERESDPEYDYFFTNASKMFSKRQSPVEGVIKYAYYHFKSMGRLELSKKVLELYGEMDVQSISDRANRSDRQGRAFNNFGLSLIFIDGGEIVESELEYIRGCIAKHPENYWSVFRFLLANEYSEMSPRLELGIRLLIDGRSFDEISNIVDIFFSDRHDYRHTGSDDKRNVSVLCDWLEHIEKQNGTLSVALKQFLVLLCAIEPYEYVLCKYKQFVLEDAVYLSLCESIQCAKLKACIQELRTHTESHLIYDDTRHSLFQLIKQGDDQDDNR